jgi:hypothetical protein
MNSCGVPEIERSAAVARVPRFGGSLLGVIWVDGLPAKIMRVLVPLLVLVCGRFETDLRMQSGAVKCHFRPLAVNLFRERQINAGPQTPRGQRTRLNPSHSS